MQSYSETLSPHVGLGKVYGAIVLILWFALVLVAAGAGAFAADPEQPPLTLLLAVAAPSLIFAASYFASPALRAFVLSLDLVVLTAFQSWRVIGITFLVLYAYGLLPAAFAFPAGIGDAFVGIAAPFVAIAIARNSSGWHQKALWLNLAGLVDFAFAVGTGVLTSPTPVGVFAGTVTSAPMSELPLILIPAFAVPLWIIVHMISLLQLRHRAAS
jgi:hypothetical protein